MRKDASGPWWQGEGPLSYTGRGGGGGGTSIIYKYSRGRGSYTVKVRGLWGEELLSYKDMSRGGASYTGIGEGGHIQVRYVGCGRRDLHHIKVCWWGEGASSPLIQLTA